jgi:hypothetical protein
MTDEPQRRDQERKPLRGVGRIFLTPSAALEVRMLDVSTRGVAAVSLANLPPGSTCTLHFSIPDSDARREWFQAAATVVATVLSADADGFRLSLRFDGQIGEAMRIAIEKYVVS